MEAKAHIRPAYPQEDISLLLDAEKLARQDYELLFCQTGLSKSAVDALRKQGRQQELLNQQQLFFADLEVDCEANTFVSREERIDKVKTPLGEAERVPIPYVEEGDILITFNSHALGWRNGHAAMVVDAEAGRTLEARVLGMDSKVMSMSHWERYPSFAVLRLKGVTKERRAEIAAYAMQTLTDIPYRLEAGIVERVKVTVQGMLGMAGASEKKVPSGTHCAHLIWYAYQHFGYNLDSDGGVVVTPCDIYESSYLEIIQIYGMLPRNY